MVAILARRLIWSLLALALLNGLAQAADEPRRLLVFDFELIDEQADVSPFPEAEERMRRVGAHLRQRLAEGGLYTVLDAGPIADEIRAAQARYSLLDCKGCEIDLAVKLGAERVMLAWVQRVSNLILNLNIEIREVPGGRTLLNKSADLRGNTERSWLRGVDFIVRDMVDRGQGNR